MDQSKARLALIPRAFALLWRAGPGLTLAMFASKALSALYPVAMLYVSKLAIDSIITVIRTPGGGAETGRLYALILALVGLWVLHSLSSNVQAAVNSLLGLKVEQSARMEIMRKCSRLDIAFFENPRHLNLLENASVGASGNVYSVIALMFSFVESVITLGSFIFVFFKLHWGVALIVVLTTLPQMLANKYFARKRWEISTGLAEQRRMQGYYSAIVQQRGPAKEIRLFGLFDEFLRRFKALAGRFVEVEGVFARKQATINFLISLVSIAGSAAVWLYVIQRAVSGAISVGDVVLFTGAVANTQGCLTSLFTLAGQILQNVLFLGNFFRLLDLAPASVEGALALPGQGASTRSAGLTVPRKLERGVEFQGVSFRYPGTERNVLEDVSVTLSPDETVAIVGQNGAGKTTLIKLLLRLYDPTEGTITLDGKDLRDYDPRSLHRAIGAIFQDFVCYPLTVRENIGLGRVDRLDGPSCVVDAARLAGADGFIERLPARYETNLGRTFGAPGIDLSTGQWQRIAMARALMRRGSPVLILDEPTAALDAYAEYEVYRKFHEITADRLSILISHRFSTVRMADRIVVLDGGRLVEEGTHAELVYEGSLYGRMYRLQADRYREEGSTGQYESISA